MEYKEAPINKKHYYQTISAVLKQVNRRNT